MNLGKLSLATALFCAGAWAQFGPNTLVAANSNSNGFDPQNYWAAGAHYVGSDVVKPIGSTAAVVVTHKSFDAFWEGVLYLIHPVTGDTVRLFKNTDAPGTSVNITAYVNLVPAGTPILFGYKVTKARVWACGMSWCTTNQPLAIDKEMKYSGINIPGVSQKVSNAPSTYGKRWAVVGNTPVAGTLEIAYEDCANQDPAASPNVSDWDYNDIIFTVSGVSYAATRSLARGGMVR